MHVRPFMVLLAAGVVLSAQGASQVLASTAPKVVGPFTGSAIGLGRP